MSVVAFVLACVALVAALCLAWECGYALSRFSAELRSIRSEPASQTDSFKIAWEHANAQNERLMALLERHLFPSVEAQADPYAELSPDVLQAAYAVMDRQRQARPSMTGQPRLPTANGTYPGREPLHDPDDSYQDPITLDSEWDQLAPHFPGAEEGDFREPMPELLGDRPGVMPIAPGENPFAGLKGLDPTVPT